MKKTSVFKFVEVVCRIGLGALFIYSALAKISDPDDFARAVMRYGVLPDFTVGIFSLTMPMLELLAGLSMLFTKWLRESALLVSGMLAMFIVALIQALARGLEISCGCFGVPSVGGREEIVIALVRDVVLIVPSVWLMFRANGRIWPLKLMSKGWYAVSLCGFGMLLATWFARDMWISGAFTPSLSPGAKGNHEVEHVTQPVETGRTVDAWLRKRLPMLNFSTGPIRPGEWNIDFEGVFTKAKNEQRPMVLLRVNKGCEYCLRLEESISGSIFRLWREDRAPLMALVLGGTQFSPRKTVKACDDFAYGIKRRLNFPYVCVYLPQNGGVNSIAFNARRGEMGGRKDKLLVVELMSALDHALGVQVTDGHKTLESIMAIAAAERVLTQVEGNGTVAMVPENGRLAEGASVELIANPDEGHVFVNWRRPDGSLAGLEPHLVVYGDMQAGCYTACFKSLLQCKPPQLVSPIEVSINVKTKERFSHKILVDESCRPVRFKLKRPVKGVKVDPVTGIVTGMFMQAMTNTFEISVIGSDPGKTEKTVRVKIEVSQRNLIMPRRRKR